MANDNLNKTGGAKVGNLHAGSTVSTNTYTQEKEVR